MWESLTEQFIGGALEQMAFGYALVAARTLALVVWLPFLFDATIPRRLSVAFALHLAAIATWALGAPRLAPDGALEAMMMLCGEVVLGCALGLTVRLVIDGVRGMGSLLSQSIGLAFAVFVDPSMGGQSTILERLGWLMMLAVLVMVDAHLEILRVFFEAFWLFPPGEVAVMLLDPMVIVARSGQLFVLALKLAAPALATSFMIYAAMGILVKVSPTMNLFVFGFALTIPAGLLALYLGAPQTVAMMSEVARSTSRQMAEVLIAWSPR